MILSAVAYYVVVNSKQDLFIREQNLSWKHVFQDGTYKEHVAGKLA